ncbi:MAG: GNAT family N-acetyltransferase [Tepidiformaceae bacterium]
MSHAIVFATAADVPALTGLINRAYEVESFFKVGPRTDEAEVGRLQAEHQFFVARDAKGIAGCVLVELRPDDGYFGMLSVEPGRQKSGLGRELIGAAERFCAERGRTVMTLVLVNLRLELPPFYRKLGYTESGTEPWPVSELEKTSVPCHFIVMTKPIGVPGGVVQLPG